MNRKFYFLVISLFLVSTFASVAFQRASAQGIEDQKKFLTQKPWHIIEDKLTGVGNHRAMNGEAEIIFSADGNWNCNQNIEGEKSGTWWLKDTSTLYLKTAKGGKEIKCELIKLTAETLRFKYKLLTAARVMEWESTEDDVER